VQKSLRKSVRLPCSILSKTKKSICPKYTCTNVFTGTAGSANNEFNQAHGIAYDWNTGTLYASDFNNHRVMQYLSGASSGSVVAGGNGAGYNNTQLYNPVGLCFDSSSNSLFIANFGAHNIVRWVVGASGWTLVAGIGGSPGITSTLLTTPGAVTLDLMGNVYVADTGNDRVQFFWSGFSNGTTIAGVTLSPGSTAIQLSSPFGIAVDAEFNVYVADYGNHRIQQYLHY
jgi:sugar lactone lactonase YvrE